MDKEHLIVWCDRIMIFSFYAMIYFLPISIALLEIFTGIALIAYLLKRLAVFINSLVDGTIDLSSVSLWHKICAFFRCFKPIENFLNGPIALLLFVKRNS